MSSGHQGMDALLTAAAGLSGLGRSRRGEAEGVGAVRSWRAFYNEKCGLLFTSGLWGWALKDFK